MRTAGRCPPAMLTRPDAGQLRQLLRDARVDEVVHRGSGTVFDVTASVSTGVSAGFTLL